MYCLPQLFASTLLSEVAWSCTPNFTTIPWDLNVLFKTNHHHRFPSEPSASLVICWLISNIVLWPFLTSSSQRDPAVESESEIEAILEAVMITSDTFMMLYLWSWMWRPKNRSVCCAFRCRLVPNKEETKWVVPAQVMCSFFTFLHSYLKSSNVVRICFLLHESAARCVSALLL